MYYFDRFSFTKSDSKDGLYYWKANNSNLILANSNYSSLPFNEELIYKPYLLVSNIISAELLDPPIYQANKKIKTKIALKAYESCKLPKDFDFHFYSINPKYVPVGVYNDGNFEFLLALYKGQIVAFSRLVDKSVFNDTHPIEFLSRLELPQIDWEEVEIPDDVKDQLFTKFFSKNYTSSGFGGLLCYPLLNTFIRTAKENAIFIKEIELREKLYEEAKIHFNINYHNKIISKTDFANNKFIRFVDSNKYEYIYYWILDKEAEKKGSTLLMHFHNNDKIKSKTYNAYISWTNYFVDDIFSN